MGVHEEGRGEILKQNSGLTDDVWMRVKSAGF